MSNKKIIIVVVGILLVSGILGLILWLRAPAAEPSGGTSSPLSRLPIIGGRLGGTPTPPSETPPGETEKLTGSEAQKLIQITDEPVIGPSLDAKGEKVLYYKKRDGHLVSNDISGGKEETVSSLTILNIFAVLWAPDKKHTLIRYEDAGTVKQLATTATSSPKVSFLPSSAGSPAWSPDGKTFSWLQQQNETVFLYSANADGTNQRRRSFTTPIPDLLMSFVTNDLVAFVSRSSFRFESPLIMYNLRTGAQTIPFARFGLRAKTDENATTEMVATTATTRTGELAGLSVFDYRTEKETTWPYKTIADKCTFTDDKKYLFCAVPRTPPARALPDDWLIGATSLNDGFYRFDLKDGTVTEVTPETEHDATSLVLSPDNKNLFFIDKKTGYLWRLSLE